MLLSVALGDNVKEASILEKATLRRAVLSEIHRGDRVITPDVLVVAVRVPTLL